MKIDGHLTPDWRLIPDHVRKMEAQGFDRVGTAEMNHDPFMPLLLAAEHSEKIEVGTGIAVAFARSPMILANLGHDLNAYSKGRMVMGLGSQIRPHITKHAMGRTCTTDERIGSGNARDLGKLVRRRATQV